MFFFQILTYGGFYDTNVEWVGLDNIQIVGSMTAVNTPGRHKLTPRFTSIVRICCISYPADEELASIFGAFLQPVLEHSLSSSAWSSPTKAQQLAGTMVKVYDEVRQKFKPDDYGHYLFTPRDLTRWIMGLLRYDLMEK